MTDPVHGAFLKTALTDYLLNHAGFLATTGINPTDPNARVDAEAKAEQMLKDPLFVAKLKGNIADVLQTLKSDDYQSLHQLFQQQDAVIVKIYDVTNEIGDPTSGLVMEIADSRKDLDNRYGMERDSKTGVVTKTGARIEDQEKAQVCKQKLSIELDKCQSKYELLNRIFTSMKQGKTITIAPTLTVVDLITGTPLTLNTLSFDEIIEHTQAYATELERIQTDMEKEDYVIRSVNTEKENLEKQIKEKEDIKAKKEADKTTLTQQHDKLAAEATAAKDELGRKEGDFAMRLQSILGETATDLWKEAKDEAEKTKGEVTKSLEETTYQRLYQLLYGEIYNDTKKHFDKGKLKTMLETMKNAPHGKAAENLGIARIQAAIVNFTIGVVAPEDAALLPFLRELAADPAKRESICIRLTTDTLQLVALKNPKLFTEMFTDDELLIRKVSNDVLPGLISKVKENPTLKKQIETELNTDLAKETKESLMEKLARLGKGKWIKLLLAILGGAALIAGKTLLMPSP
ncbi:MAG TPA: hypothetical protein VJH96_04110 [Patescibacteria group bacterium]|nr:hypothetical protein [Patescibacteria group bacterium]